MTTSTMKMPASYSAIEAEEMTYLDGGASNAYQAFLDVGKVFNYIARIFSGARITPKFGYGSRAFFEKVRLPFFVGALIQCITARNFAPQNYEGKF